MKLNSSVECWGSNEFNADYVGQATPPDGPFTLVSAGLAHTCGVKLDGSVECWGLNEYGQATPPDGEFALVSAGGGHTCGVRLDGSVECWGLNELDGIFYRSNHFAWRASSPWLAPVKDIAAG